MEIPIEEFLPPAFEILWDIIDAKKYVMGVNVKQLLARQLRLALAKEHHKDQLNENAKISNKELRRIISDLMRLRRIALKMQSKERKILFYTLILALATAILENGAVEKIGGGKFIEWQNKSR